MQDTDDQTFVTIPRPHQKDTVKLLTLNVDCLPFPLTRAGDERILRICQQIISEDIDIVCFQECFDKRVQEIVCQTFMETHPYQLLHQKYNAMGVLDWVNWLEESGIVAVSKFPG